MRTRTLHPTLVLFLACALALLLTLLDSAGAHIWGQYLLPVLVVFFWGRRRDLYIVTTLTSVLVVAAHWGEGLADHDSPLNSAILPLLLLWGATWLLARGRQLQEGLVSRIQDLDKQLKARGAALTARDEQLASILRANPGGIVVTRQSDGCFLEANDVYLSLVGRTRAELIGHTMVELGILSSESSAALRAAFHPQDGLHGLGIQFTNARGEPVDVVLSREEIEYDGEPCSLDLLVDITAHKQMERKAAGLDAIVQSSTDAIISADLDGTLRSINLAAEHLFGIAAGEAVGRHISNLKPDLPEFARGAIFALLRAGETVTLPDLTWTTPSGRRADLAVTALTLCDFDGRALGAAIVTRDITERKRAEGALRRFAERFTELFHASPVGLTLSRLADGVYQEVNRAFLALTGYQRDEVIGHTIVELGIISLEDRNRLAAMVCEHDYRHGTDLAVRTKSGTTVTAIFAIELLEVEGETWLLSSIVDITEQKHVEARLRDANQRLQLATDAAGIGIWHWNCADNSLDWDDRMCELYAVTAKERRAGIFYDLWRARVHPDDLALAEPAQGDLTRIEGQWSGTYRIVLPGGAVRHIQASSVTEYDGDGRPHRIVGVNRDITEQVHYDQLLQEANVMLEERVNARTADLRAALTDLQRSNQLKDEFMAMISHELRTPLTGVLTMAELLGDQIAGPLNERQAQYAKGIAHSGERLLTIINGILGYTHLLAGKVKLQPEPCQLAYLLGVCAASQQQQASAKGHVITLQVDPPDLGFTTDSTALSEIIKRLLDNAIKFTPQGGQIGIDAHPSAAHGAPERMIGPDRPAALDVVIWDTGIGIAADQLDHIVKPFTQADASLARSHEGIGLGLAYADQMVRLLGGFLTITSTPGEGSRFTITLPLSAPSHTH